MEEAEPPFRGIQKWHSATGSMGREALLGASDVWNPVTPFEVYLIGTGSNPVAISRGSEPAYTLTPLNPLTPLTPLTPPGNCALTTPCRCRHE